MYVFIGKIDTILGLPIENCPKKNKKKNMVELLALKVHTVGHLNFIKLYQMF